MLLAIVLAVILAVMRLSPNPVFRAVSWCTCGCSADPGVRAVGVLGPDPHHLQNIQLGIPFGPTFFHLNIQNLSMYFVLAILGLGFNRAAYLAEIIRPASVRCPKDRRRPRPRWVCRGCSRCAERCCHRRCG